MKDNWSDYERFLKPVHLNGKAVTLTIIKATEEETHPQKGTAVISPVIWFRELPFGLILSPTNRQTLWELYGDSIKGAIGKPITVQAFSMKVAGNAKQPIRILKQRPATPSVEPTTGEILPSPVAAGDNAIQAVEGKGEPPSELDAHFGTPKITAPPTADNQPPAATYETLWPATEAEYVLWLKDHGWNGKETHSALGTDAKTWLRQNPGKTWADVAKTVAATLGQ